MELNEARGRKYRYERSYLAINELIVVQKKKDMTFIDYVIRVNCLLNYIDFIKRGERERVLGVCTSVSRVCVRMRA